MLRGANLPTLGDFNQRLVLDVIRRHPEGIGRVAVGAATGLTPQTVSNIVRRLGEAGLVAEGERVRTPRGKPPTLLHIEPTRHVAVGIHIDPAQVSALSMDLAGVVHRVASAPTPPEVTPATAVAMVQQLTREVLEDWSGAAGEDAVLGIGVAAPGPIDLEHGSLRRPPQLHGWADVPFRDTLHDALGWPVLLDKDVIAAVTGEHWAPDGPRDDFVYVYLGSGMAVGAVLGGRVHRGTTNNAGRDPGAVRPGPAADHPGRPGGRGRSAAERAADLLRGAAGLRGTLSPWPIGTRAPRACSTTPSIPWPAVSPPWSTCSMSVEWCSADRPGRWSPTAGSSDCHAGWTVDSPPGPRWPSTAAVWPTTARRTALPPWSCITS